MKCFLSLVVASVTTLVAVGAPFLQSELPAGEGRATVQRTCNGCHAISVVTSTRRTPAEWRITVENMVARGAVASAPEIDTVVNYLAQHYARTASTQIAPPAASFSVGDVTGPAGAKSFDRQLSAPSDGQWPIYGRDPGAQRYSPLRQIAPGNVSRLARAWTFHLGAPGSEAIPLVIDNRMYVTASDAIFALEPETGKMLWKYSSQGVARRGLAYWRGNAGSPRLYCGVESGKLVALDALTGKPVESFGDNGLIDLKRGVADGLPNARFQLASPPSIYQNIVITGGSNGELAPSQGAYGDVRGWDAHTGKLRGLSIPCRDPVNQVTKPGLQEAGCIAPASMCGAL